MNTAKLKAVGQTLDRAAVIAILSDATKPYSITDLNNRCPELSIQNIKTLAKHHDPRKQREGRRIAKARKQLQKPAEILSEPPPLPEFPEPVYETVVPKPAPKAIQQHSHVAAYLIGSGFILIGLTAAGVGGIMNWQFGYSVAGFTGGIIGAVIDGGALLFLPASRELFRLRNPLCLVAFLAWFPFVGGSTYAALNYTGVNVGDYFKARSDVANLETTLNQQKIRLEAKRPKETRSVAEIDLAIMNAYRDDRPAWRKLREVAIERDNIDTQIADINQQLRTLPHIASKNPAAEQIAQISGGEVSADQATSYSIRWWAVVPGFASLMLTIGLAMFTKKKQT